MEKSQSTQVQLKLIKIKKYVKQLKRYWIEVKAIYGIDPNVYNIAAVLPMIRESFPGKYIELDFSENLALKPRHEIQFKMLISLENSISSLFNF